MSKISLDKPQIICHVEKSLNYSLYDCKWVPGTAKFVVMGSMPNGAGSVHMYELSPGDVKLAKTINKSVALKCGTFGASDHGSSHLATGDFNGRLDIWDLEKPEAPIYSVGGHKGIINAIDGVGGRSTGCGAPEIVTGCRDGSVRVWDPRQKDKPVAVMEPVSELSTRDCWTVGFGNSYNSEQRVVCAGYDNGDIKLFDLNKMCVRWEENIKNGVCCVEFDRRDIQMNKLVVTSLEAKLHVFDMKVQHPTKGYPKLTEKAHKSTIWLCRHLPQNREIFMTGGGAGSVCLWKYNYPEARSKRGQDGNEIGCAGTLSLLQNATLSTQPVSSLDWCPDKQGLAVCTAFDQAFRILIVTKLHQY